MNQTSTRYALLDELRGLDLISMMLYHGTWDAVYLFGVAVPWYAGTPGRLWQQSICWGFILLSGFCLPMGHHPVKRGAVVFGAGALVTGRDAAVHAGECRLIRRADPAGLGDDPDRAAGKGPAKGSAGGGLPRQLCAVCADLSHDGRLLGPWGTALAAAAGPVRKLLYSLSGLLPPRLFLHRLLSASAVAVFILGGILPLSSHRAGEDETAAPVGLSASGVAGAALAGAVPAPSAGHFRSDDGGVFPPAAALSREVEKSAKEP